MSRGVVLMIACTVGCAGPSAQAPDAPSSPAQPDPSTSGNTAAATPPDEPPPVATDPVGTPPEPGCRQARTAPRPRPDSGCGSCVQRWERQDVAFQPETVWVCDRCQTDADCSGGRCVSAYAAESGTYEQMCTQHVECSGTWIGQGGQAFCQPRPEPGGPLPP